MGAGRVCVRGLAHVVIRPAPIVPVYANTRVLHVPAGFEPYWGETFAWVEVSSTRPETRSASLWRTDADYVEGDWD